MSAIYHRIRYMSPSSESFESVREAVCAALWESANCYASPRKITQNRQTLWDSELQDLDDFAESIGVNPDLY